MPNPRGEKRPADVIGAAVMVGRIATGEVKDNPTAPDKAHHSLGAADQLPPDFPALV